MSVNYLLIILSLIIAFIILLLIISKKICDMAIKSEIAKKYTSLIFTPEQIEAMNNSDENSIKWLEQNSDEVEIISRDGLKLKGYQTKLKEESNIWVIAVHGYMGKGSDMVQYVKEFHNYGYNSLIVDLRTHGKSEGQYIGMGWLDQYDLELWIAKIIEENKNCKIILYGISMGAATVSMTTGNNIPNNVKVCIADCGYTSVWDEFAIHLKKILHVLPFPLLYISSLMSKMYAGYGFKEASTVKQVKKSKTPTLFIHGKEDKFVPFTMLEKIYKYTKCEKQKLEIENATHANSTNINPVKYWQTVQKFIERYI